MSSSTPSSLKSKMQGLAGRSAKKQFESSASSSSMALTSPPPSMTFKSAGRAASKSPVKREAEFVPQSKVFDSNLSNASSTFQKIALDKSEVVNTPVFFGTPKKNRSSSSSGASSATIRSPVHRPILSGLPNLAEDVDSAPSSPATIRPTKVVKTSSANSRMTAVASETVDDISSLTTKSRYSINWCLRGTCSNCGIEGDKAMLMEHEC